MSLSTSRNSWWSIGVAILMVALLILAWLLLPLKDWFLAFGEWSRALGWAGIILFGAIYVLATLLLVPGFPMTLALAFAYGWWAIAVSFTAGLTAALFAFLIARYAGRAAGKRFARRYPVLKALDSVAAEDGFKAVALFRLSPVAPFAPSNYAFGMSAVDVRSFLLGTAIGVIPGTVLNVYIGVVGRTAAAGEASAVTWIGLAIGLLATVSLTVWLGRAARARMKGR